MRKFRRAAACAFIGVVTAGAGATDALAACANLAGVWHVFLMQGAAPATVTTSVRKGDDSGPMNIRVFQNNAHSSAVALAIKCRLVIAADGTFGGDQCTSYGVVAGDGGVVTVDGQINFPANGCQITGGIINVSGDPTPVTFLGGYVNGQQKHGAGIARQGASSVFLFNMERQ